MRRFVRAFLRHHRAFLRHQVILRRTCRGVLVLAAVSDLQYQRLRGAVLPPFSLARATTWDVALETIRGRPVEIAVVDPMLGGARGQEVERLRVLFPSLPLILYTPIMTAELAPGLL